MELVGQPFVGMLGCLLDQLVEAKHNILGKVGGPWLARSFLTSEPHA